MHSDITKDVKVFISYAEKDTKFKDELEKHLSFLKRQGLISTLSKRNITMPSRMLCNGEWFAQKQGDRMKLSRSQGRTPGRAGRKGQAKGKRLHKTSTLKHLLLSRAVPGSAFPRSGALTQSSPCETE